MTRTAAILLTLAVSMGSCSSDPSSGPCNDPTLQSEMCYAARRDPQSEQVALATDIAVRYIEEHPPTTELFDWTSGVLMFAMTELYRVSGDSRLRDYYSDWLDYHIARGYVVNQSDSCPPALTALALLADGHENPSYRQVLDDVLFYLRDVAPRNAQGGIAHFGTALNTDSIWIDSLFMFGMVLNRQGELDSDTAALDLLAEQYGVFEALPQSPSGLMLHAYEWPPGTDDDIYWARGNSWVTVSLVDYLRVRSSRDETDAGAARMLRAQVDALLEAQDEPTGMWWNLINRPGEIYIETSGPALIAYAFARGYRYGILGDEELAAAKRAMVGVQSAIAFDDQDRPFVTDISDGTTAGTYELYANIPLVDDLNYGVGAVILALVETSGL